MPGACWAGETGWRGEGVEEQGPEAFSCRHAQEWGSCYRRALEWGLSLARSVGACCPGALGLLSRPAPIYSPAAERTAPPSTRRRWKQQNNGSWALLPEASHAGHVLALYLDTRGDFIVVGAQGLGLGLV